jgi:hypothetical protein
MISLGSLDEVVFMLHVNRNDLGLISPLSLTALLQSYQKFNLMLDRRNILTGISETVTRNRK